MLETRAGASRRRTAGTAGVLLILALTPIPARGQTPPSGGGGSDVTFLSINALVGGLTVGVASRARGGPFLEPFARGALGGAVSYGGKRLGAASWGGSGLVGRQVAAVGASLVRNASVGAGLLDTLFVPLGPGRLHVSIRGDPTALYRLDLEEVGWLVYSLSQDHLRLDLAETVSSGAFVVEGDDRLRGEDDDAIGRAAPGIISIRRQGALVDGQTLAHERAHVAQLDYLKIVLGLPAEGWIRQEAGLAPGAWHDHLEIGLGYYPILWLLTAPWSAHASRPLEREAEFVESLRRP